MLMLYDRFPELPYRAVAPWPLVELNGQLDWVASVDAVETWLTRSIGYHWVHWSWNMRDLEDSSLCGVCFTLERSCTLFLLKFAR